jgi:hypothetical protein
MSRFSQGIAGYNNHSGGKRLFQLRQGGGRARRAVCSWGSKPTQVIKSHTTPVKNQHHPLTALDVTHHLTVLFPADLAAIGDALVARFEELLELLVRHDALALALD